MNSRGLPVLMYHGIHDDAHSDGHYDPVYSVRPEEFAAQLDWLAGSGYRTTLLRGMAEVPQAERSVVISFDDGDVSNVEVALPMLLSRGMVAEFFVTSDFIDRPGMLRSDDLRKLVDAGMSVQSHGRTHRFLEDLSATDLDAELRDSKQHLETASGTVVDALALPGGRGGERERIAAMRAGYRCVLNSEPGNNRAWRDGRYLQRLGVRRDLPISEFAQLVAWRGLTPHLAAMRYRLLGLPKRLLGNARYERFRARVLRRR